MFVSQPGSRRDGDPEEKMRMCVIKRDEVAIIIYYGKLLKNQERNGLRFGSSLRVGKVLTPSQRLS